LAEGHRSGTVVPMSNGSDLNIDDMNLADMTIDNLIGDDVVTVADDATLLGVAQTLTEADVSAVVVGSTSSVTGVVSERDIVRAVAEGADLAKTSAKAAASSTVVWADGATNVADVAGQMMEQWVRHILVEKDGGLIGIVSARDLLGLYASSDSD